MSHVISITYTLIKDNKNSHICKQFPSIHPTIDFVILTLFNLGSEVVNLAIGEIFTYGNFTVATPHTYETYNAEQIHMLKHYIF